MAFIKVSLLYEGRGSSVVTDNRYTLLPRHFSSQQQARETQEAVSRVHRERNFTEIESCFLTFLCHREDTVERVLSVCLPEPSCHQVVITRHPDRAKGRAAVLGYLIGEDCPLIHVDDSPEVLQDFLNYRRLHQLTHWQRIGISVPRKRQVQSVPYVRNIRDAFEFIEEHVEPSDPGRLSASQLQLRILKNQLGTTNKKGNSNNNKSLIFP